MYEIISPPRLAGSSGRAASSRIALDQPARFCEISPLLEGASEMRCHLNLCNWTFATLLFLATAAGCASDQAVPQAASSADPLAAQARLLRNSDGERQGTGLSSTARDIEKDF